MSLMAAENQQDRWQPGDVLIRVSGAEVDGVNGEYVSRGQQYGHDALFVEELPINENSGLEGAGYNYNSILMDGYHIVPDDGIPLDPGYIMPSESIRLETNEEEDGHWWERAGYNFISLLLEAVEAWDKEWEINVLYGPCPARFNLFRKEQVYYNRVHRISLFPPQDDWERTPENLDPDPRPSPTVIAVLSRMCRYHLADLYRDRIEKEVPPYKKAVLIQQVERFRESNDSTPSDCDGIEQTLERIKEVEMGVLLYLAVWKAAAVVAMPEGGYLKSILWRMEGWKAKKFSVDQSNVLTIVNLVRVFYEMP